jgi:hypothetical protein
MNIQELHVEPGEPIQPAWERLRAWVEGLQVLTTGPGARVHYSPRQIDVVYDPDVASFIPEFKVQVSSAELEASVGLGFLNNILPRIDGLKINGESDDGETMGEPPILDLSDGPNEASQSWVCLQAQIDPATGKLLMGAESLSPEAVTITHRNTLPDLRDGGVKDDKGKGAYPLALLQWTEDRQRVCCRQLRSSLLFCLSHGIPHHCRGLE